MKFSASFLMISLSLIAGQSYAQNTVDSPDELLGQTKAITTAVPFLAISPDARHAALGDAGVASSPDANASYWNPAKLTFIDKHYGGSISYTPWLGKIINDMSISYLTLFYKIGREQAVSGSLKYFDLGDIFFTENGVDGTNFNPREYAVDLTYSRKLTEEFSVGLTGRYIHSNLTGAFSSGGVDAQPGKSVAVDLGVFYTKQLQSAKSSNLSLGASISNIGAKISYSDSNNEDFLPTNLRLGGAFTTELDPYNSITFLLDFNKLMVPTIDEGQSVLDGMFSSFTDAPGGFSEEIQEIMTSMGVEYWYHEVFAARLGYFLEAYEKGNRKYLTLGAGFRKNNFGFDMAYLVPTNKREHPLAETLRFTLLFQINNDQPELDNSVTE
jgi:hypothetical protein